MNKAAKLFASFYEPTDNAMFVSPDQDECQVNKGGCSHYCIDQPMGFICHCPDNMRLVEDSHCEGELQPQEVAL